ncbi:hypothetical protein [Ktedonospora formicarum]|uniref:DUF2029 domain-containing protein n=1 Tax=Ktedonospora formicarum TaxID=2778364 RepID=A0A8J3I0X5_9CHLR|nr:hypothetical protein [Ktedonospora formicarum]GHO42879.1 hypothetical protein KSX_10420 [Ktedonospora formicarum]
MAQEELQLTYTEKRHGWFLPFMETLHNPRKLAAYIPIIFATIAMFIGTSWQLFLPKSDPARYQCYALTFWFGGNAIKMLPAEQCAFLSSMLQSSPFRMLPLEYPSLTIIPFSLALLAPLPYYQLVFAFLMSLMAFCIYWLLLRYGPYQSALTYTFYLLIGAVATTQVRFDILPAALTLIALIAAERKHWTSAYLALALGTLLKLYPLLLLPALFIAEQRSLGRFYQPPRHIDMRALPHALWSTLREVRHWSWRNCLLCFASILGVTGLFALLNFDGAVLSQLEYFFKRPLQVESVGGSLLWLASHVGYPITTSYDFGSININSALGDMTSKLSTLGLVAGYSYALYLQWRGRLTLGQCFIALHLVFIATGKVFSPQYLIWLLPLLAYVYSTEGIWLLTWGAISLLTTFIYAYFYSHSPDLTHVPGFFEWVTVRNTLFVLLTLAFLSNWRHIRSPRYTRLGHEAFVSMLSH